MIKHYFYIIINDYLCKRIKLTGRVNDLVCNRNSGLPSTQFTKKTLYNNINITKNE